mmetsp:Transcript_7924/g.22241  ORF Transcript_7924/g.22241 Transcript_7924/m.22241 type:complete len:1014 (+) Transcript_7924:55-3096(+)
MRALLAILVLLRAGTQARMATPCRAGTDHCKIVNTQKSIRAAADRARKSAAEAKDAVRMSRATSVAREAAVRALTNLVNTPRHVEAAQASLAKTKASAARVERLAPSIQRDNLVDLALAAVNAADEATQAQVAAAAARAVADLHALAPVTREEHRPAVKRSAERAAKASRLVADHGHLLPPDLREKAHDLLNEHDFRVHAALDSARPGPALAAIQKKESGYLKAFQKLGGERAATKAKQLPKDEERRKLRATRDVLRAATGLDAEEPVWGAPFRALEALFGEGHAPMEALGVSAKFFEDGRSLTKRYHVALQPPCDCWTFGRAAVVEQARGVAESLKAPPLVEAWLDSIAADDTGKLPSVGFGVSAEDGACKLYVLNYGGNELPPLPLLDSLPQTARKPDRAPSVLVSVEWKFGDMKTQQMRQYAVEASADDVAVARHTQDERFAGDELVAALDGTFGVKQSEDIAVTAPFQYDKATTPPVVAAPLAKSGLKLKRQDGNIDSNAETDAKLAALLKDAAPGAGAWLDKSRVIRHALSNVQFGEGFVTLYRHPTVFGFVDPSSAPQHLALRNALTKNTHSLRRRLSGLTACDQAEEDFIDRAVWGSNPDDSTCAQDGKNPANAGMCPQSCQDDIACMIAACSDCALVDAVCDEPVDLGAHPSLASGDLRFQYKAPVVMAGADGSNRDNIEGDCHTYVDQSDIVQPLGRKSLEGQLEDDVQCKDKHQDDIDFDCWVESDHNDAGTATIVCEGCSPDGTQSGFEAAMATFFQNLVASTGGPCSFDAAASLTSLAGATSNVQSRYSDVDDAMVPDNKKLQMPYGDSGLFETMNLWGPEGCRYPYYGFLPDEPLCKDCSSMAQAKEDVLNGLWDGPCNDDDPRGDDDSLPLPPNYPGCGCDCADFLRRDLSCTSESCVNVAQAYAASNTVCAGDKLRWDTTSSSTGCETYGAGSPLTGSACLDAAGAVPNATCYRTPAAISEPGFPWPWPDVCYHMQRDAALGRRASALALVGAIVMMV